MTTQTATSTLLTTSEIKGTTVRNLQNQEIGAIDELLIVPHTGTIRFAVLSVGGFLGMGTTRVAVPWRAFDLVQQRDRKLQFTLEATKERLERAPRIDAKTYDRLYTDEASEPIYGYWEVDYSD